jgi:hypothetical protein
MSHYTYFGGRTPGEQIVYVLLSDPILDKGTQERWEVSWNTGCYPHQLPENRYHPTLSAAVEAAEAEVARVPAQPKEPCRA